MTNVADQGQAAEGGSPPLKILVLGGTSEASALAALLAGRPAFDVTLSLAGRTRAPRLGPLRTRIGGFGGPEGLAAWLAASAIDRVIDATHPFAVRISANAARACAQAGATLLALRRPPWTPQAGDRWRTVESVAACVPALGAAPRRVFLTVGRQEVGAFATAPQHAYLVRSIEPLDSLPLPDLAWIGARGPFSVEDEVALMREFRTDLLVTKNAGGAATYAKIEAARRLGLPVLIVERPPVPEVPVVADARDALAWLEAGVTAPAGSTGA
ncbi:cobalt-precorrin-6A reductase [Methylobacterium sp. Leaf118]|uniref:cobalt-precorrin-6A reductase n=1 Tax=Methylobacterium sp. Leaf118 TaxID=2876562 RepID=UPI001E52FB78|nr:cobalt-precorrin-6A reductase [Methylobacterium sp. Leaf118]